MVRNGLLGKIYEFSWCHLQCKQLSYHITITSPPKVLLLCCSWGACMSRSPQRLCQLEFLAPGRCHHAGQALWERPDEMPHTAGYSSDPRGYVIWNFGSFRSYHDEQALTEGPDKPAHHWCWQHQWNTDLMPTLMFGRSPDQWYGNPTKRNALVVTSATCFTHAHCPVIWNPQLVMLVIRSVVRSLYCISVARYPGMRKSRPVKVQDNQESKVWPPPLCTLSRLSGFVFLTLYRAIPSYEVVEKCIPWGVKVGDWSTTWWIVCHREQQPIWGGVAVDVWMTFGVGHSVCVLSEVGFQT